MRILITGISGLLGSELAQQLSRDHEVSGMTRDSSLPGFPVQNVDISDAEAVYRAVTKTNPDLVIHAAALSNVDECEKNPDLAYRMNGLGTRNIATACQRFDAALLYISTDYVFSGNNPPRDGYDEMDSPDPLSVYGKSKLWGEWYTSHLLNRFFIVRVSWLFGRNRANFISQIASALLEQKPFKTVTDMVSAPTHVKDLAEAIGQLIETHRYGIFHLTNTGFVSRYQIALEIAKLLDAPVDAIEKVRLKDLNLAAPRPSFSGMRNHLWALEGFPLLRPWQQAAKDFLIESKLMI